MLRGGGFDSLGGWFLEKLSLLAHKSFLVLFANRHLDLAILDYLLVLALLYCLVFCTMRTSLPLLANRHFFFMLAMLNNCLLSAVLLLLILLAEFELTTF